METLHSKSTSKNYVLQEGRIIEVATEQEIPVPSFKKKRQFLNELNGGKGFNGWTPSFFLRPSMLSDNIQE